MRCADRVVELAGRSAAADMTALCLLALVPARSIAEPILPAVVAKELEPLAEQCRGVGGKPTTERVVKRVDLNGDGRDNFVLDAGSIDCDGAPGIYGWPSKTWCMERKSRARVRQRNSG